MHSSISNSNQRLPHLAWWTILLGAVLVWAAFVAVMELRLAAKGFHRTVIDSEALWQAERARAQTLGERALIIVGGSRIQLGLNLEVLRELTGLEPVQLAIDGTPPLPVLEGLARDPMIGGTVLVDYYDHMLGPEGGNNRGREFEHRFEQSLATGWLLDYEQIEGYLSQRWRQALRSYADGARPLTTLQMRILGGTTPQYLVTLPDRSRWADYQRVAMPDFYYQRVIRSLGKSEVRLPSGSTYEDLRRLLASRIQQLQPLDETVYMSQERLEYLESLVQAIQRRGGQVVFVVMPASGMVREIEQRQFPRSRFWDRWTALTSTHTVHFEDVPALRDFVCPDGAHLDYRDQVRFTTALVVAAGLERRKKNSGM
ncbi:MAG: hypothetical protein ACOYMW_08670 [Candidatus Competibacteraceae bacterium]